LDRSQNYLRHIQTQIIGPLNGKNKWDLELENLKETFIRFLHILLSVRLQIASTQRLSIRLTPPAKQLDLVDRQISTAARYLRAFAVWSIHLREGKSYTPLETLLKHQLDGLCATFRFPGENIDTLETKAPSELYAVVWHRGVGYKVLLSDSEGVFSTGAIADQLATIKSSEIVRFIVFGLLAL
jgi:hypothetical protein